MSAYLSKFSDEFKQFFTKNSRINDFTSADEKVRAKAILDANDVKKNLLLKLNYFLLSGDYAKYEEALGLLEKSEKIINENIIVEIGDDKPETKKIEEEAYNYIKDFNNYLLTEISNIKELILGLKNKVEFSDKIIVNDTNERKKGLLKFIDSNVPDRLKKLTSLNISLIYCDHFLHVKSIELLIYIEKELKKISAEKASQPLLAKCLFLKAKILYRVIEENPDKEIFLKDNYDEERISPKKFIVDIFLEWSEYIKTHYEIRKDVSILEIKKKYTKIKDDTLDSLSIKDLHLKIKYYKDIDPTKKVENITHVRQEIERRYYAVKNENSFDKYSLTICLNYAINNEFSLLISKGDYVEIQKLYDEICLIQATTGFKNYFPQFKYAEYISQLLVTIFKKNDAYKELKNIKDKIDQAETAIEAYEQNLYWCEENLKFIFQLPHSECLIKYDSDPELQNLFVASSFILPVSELQYKKQFSLIKQKIESNSILVTSLNNIDSEIKNLNIQTRQLSDSTLRNIEILGVFTAIISFVAANVQGFAFIKTAEQATLFTISLAASFGIFLLTLFYVTRIVLYRKYSEWFYRIVGVILLLFLIGIGGYLLSKYNIKLTSKKVEVPTISAPIPTNIGPAK